MQAPAAGTQRPAAGAAAVPGLPPQVAVAAAGAAVQHLPLYSILGGLAAQLPQQVGQPTPAAIAHQKTFLAILVFQAVMGILSLIRLFDFLTFFLTGCGVALGYTAYKHFMHITYIAAWGILCTIMGIMQVIGEIFPILFGIFTLKLSEAMVRLAIPVSSLLGAAFAWHIYVDYANANDVFDFGLHNAFKDPLAKYLTHADYAHPPGYGAAGVPQAGGQAGVPPAARNAV
eukprot:TRINITY_DN25761_c0_g1_i1.p1 TRINITY_DN25761_c0_g1~~TRINITY_DN25761_c0_g1_i1.p1  ORF type:complete len:230 (-),score=35.02 TRINITY_DN25761_c0_g1_i1:271-960(-)